MAKHIQTGADASLGTVTATSFIGDGSSLTGISAGADIGTANTWTAEQTFDAGIQLNNSDSAYFGTNNDLQIYHNGDNAIITNNTGTLYFSSPAYSFENNNYTQMLYLGVGGVELKSSGNTKLTTISTGVDITGNITVSGTVDGRDIANDGNKLDGIESNATADQTKSDIDALGIDAATINSGLTVQTSVPAGALFTDTNYYPTTFAWSNGTTAGPTGSLSGVNMQAVSFGAFPSANGTTNSGIVTTTTQTFGGTKTFTSQLVADGGIQLNDGDVLYIGTGDDLQLMHNGSASYISQVSALDLYIRNLAAGRDIIC